MEPVIWTEQFSVGVTRIDNQHKRLIGMINRLIGSPRVTTQSETVSDLLTDMTDYAREHFATEEELMARYNYPDTQMHIDEHRRFQKETARLCAATMADIEVVPDVMLTFLKEWLTHHILTTDKAYKSFFRKHNIQ